MSIGKEAASGIVSKFLHGNKGNETAGGPAQRNRRGENMSRVQYQIHDVVISRHAVRTTNALSLPPDRRVPRQVSNSLVGSFEGVDSNKLNEDDHIKHLPRIPGPGRVVTKSSSFSSRGSVLSTNWYGPTKLDVAGIGVRETTSCNLGRPEVGLFFFDGESG